MGSANESPDLKNTFNHTGSYSPFSPSPFQLPAPTLGKAILSSNNNNNKSSLEGVNYHHQRCSSESFLMEEQPSWLDDLLNETDTVNVFHRGLHRRSASDSYAYFGESAEDSFTFEDENNYIHSLVGASSTGTHNLMLEAKNNNQESEERISSSLEQHSNEESADKASCGSQVKPFGGSKADSKRSKQHNAHRSRVRKLQYIAHLERSVQVLKAEGSEVSAALGFLEQQNIILTMENRALRQRLESISQEHIIKNWEQGMLEREIGRLQSLYQMQKQQQMQNQPHSQQNHPKHRRNKSLDHQMNGAPLKINYKDALSSKGTVNGSFRV